MTESYFDIHCHILPAVDDGAADLTEALAMIQMACEDRISHMVLTPHYQKGVYELPAEELRRRFVHFQKEAQKRYPDLKLYLGTEVCYHTGIAQKYENNEILTMADTACTLVEFFPKTEKKELVRGLQEIQMTGKKPILAHLERYECLRGDFNTIDQMLEMGIRMQVNASSVLGKSGFRTGRFVKKLLDYEMITFIGTDAHGVQRRRPLLQDCAAYLTRKWSAAYAQKLLFQNPSSMIGKENI